MKVYGVINKKTKKLESRFAYVKGSIADYKAKKYMRVSGWKLTLGAKVLNIPDNTPTYSDSPKTFLVPYELMAT